VAWTTEKGKDQRIEGPPVTMKMAKAEGWVDKNGSKWKTMPELMIRYRAAAFFGRLYTPEIMMGMQTKEEILDIQHADLSPETTKKVKESERVRMLIEQASTLEELEELAPFVDDSQLDLFTVKKDELNGNV
jgi:hypothetical protein